MTDSTDVTDPRSRHNLHVTERADLTDIGPWSADQLYRAVERADTEDSVVVLDYGREQLYLVDRDSVAYLPPAALGFAEEPGLQVTDPRRYNPDGDTLVRGRRASVTVTPEFDILVPAFDWEEPDEYWEPPELVSTERSTDSPSGAVGG